MADSFFLFFRSWPGFSTPFPFDRFNSLSDGEVVAALEAYADELRQSPEEQDKIEQRRLSRVEAVRQQAKRVPIGNAGGPVFDPHPDQSLPAICRVGAQLGWWQREIVGMAVPGSRVWVYETRFSELAEYLATEKLPGTDELGHDEVVDKSFVNPRFGFVPAVTMSAGDQASARRCMARIAGGGLPAVPFPEVVYMVAGWAHRIAAEIGAVWELEKRAEGSEEERQGEDEEKGGAKGGHRKWGHFYEFAVGYREKNPRDSWKEVVNEYKKKFSRRDAPSPTRACQVHCEYRKREQNPK
jgi:hypothetical protein